MRALVRFGPTRLLLLLLADRNVFRRSTEEALKTEMLARQPAGQVLRMLIPAERAQTGGSDAGPPQRRAENL